MNFFDGMHLQWLLMLTHQHHNVRVYVVEKVWREGEEREEGG